MTHFELTTYECIWFHMLWSDCLLMHVVCLWLFDECSKLSDKMDFHNESHHLWCPHHALSYKFNRAGDPRLKLLYISRLSGHSLLDLGHLAASNQWYSSGSTKCLEVCVTVWRSMLNGIPCYHIVVIFIASFFMSQSHIFFLKHHFRVISLSIDSTYISTVRWVSFFYCSSVMSSSWGLRLTCPELVWITLAHHQAHYVAFLCFCSCLILHYGLCGIIHTCLLLLWFYTKSFLIATVHAMPIIIAVLNLWP